MNDCVFCSTPNSEYIIKKYKHWTLSLHFNQSLLGRTILALNRHLTKMSELKPEEITELFERVKELENIYETKLNAAKINYSVLGNEADHLHMHIIPRYKDTTIFCGIKFFDHKYGSNPYPYDKSFQTPKKVIKKLQIILQSLTTIDR